ncbi:hypothetical protein LCGC14_1740400 [marine sediment metagenome]|uniref:Peptidoglycan-binding protein LysM n=1 Tax=marine sediment metagenome TaxID=412755 RepID=A0A0F9K6L6_9ZZZZ
MKYVKTILFLITTYFLSSLAVPEDSPVVNLELDNKIELTEQIIPTKPVGMFTSYMNKMGKLESNNNYTVVNRYGYMGKYQFGKSTLRALKRQGYLDITEKEIVGFRYLSELQERSMIALSTANLDYLKRNDLLRYVDTYVGGVKITRDGLLAGMHLRGAYSVKQYLQSNGNINKYDGNNTTVKDYINQFV